MVCDKCEAKLGKVITPDPWKSGARNTVESGGRKVNENKALSNLKSSRSNPVGVFRPCRWVKNACPSQNLSTDTESLFQDMQTEGAPVWIALLPSMCLQEGNLCHVREKDVGHEELPSEFHLNPVCIQWCPLLINYPKIREDALYQ